MTEISDTPRTATMDRFLRLAAERKSIIRDYAVAISGNAGRLVFSLVYFVALANTLSLAEFGLFATASAAGVLLSRVLSFGFISVLYRMATIRPRLLGAYTAGFLALSALSLPVLAAAATVVYLAAFAGQVSPRTFALVIAAEALVWRPTEAVMIVNNGLGRFGRTTVLVILAMLLRSLAALSLAFVPGADLALWSWLYLAANLAALVVGVAFFYPHQRLRFDKRLYGPRVVHSLAVAGAEILFYLQMEFDKLLVLTFGGPNLAGIYAIIMRLVDLTAIPIRTFTMMLVQKIMKSPDLLRRFSLTASIEAGVFLVSTLAIAALALILHVYPKALGSNVAEAAPLLWLAMLVPGFRNLVEYQAELLFARGQVKIRALNLALLAGAKAVLLIWLLSRVDDTAELVALLNAAFAALYLASLLLTYSAMRLPWKPV
ncbi:MAG TPA: lipopolysaccharide biosynthesis protein [Rhizobiales bacterium]|nr:lipopolysaccharide biosynthesis protein [Hyphomicrobiales bacterium]